MTMTMTSEPLGAPQVVEEVLRSWLGSTVSHVVITHLRDDIIDALEDQHWL